MGVRVAVAAAAVKGVAICVLLLGAWALQSQPAAQPRAPGEPPAARYVLWPTVDGGYRYDGPDLTAHVARDGTVTFMRGPDFVIPDGPQHPRERGREAISGGEQQWARQEPVMVESRPGVRLDVTEEYMRRLGQDPDRPEKADFLAATFELRTQMMATEQRRLLGQALEQLPSRLEALWSNPSLTPAERRQILALWRSELGEGPGAAEAARIIDDFASKHVPSSEAEDASR